jgi:RimJ/RimL family protein N-acetyltransferase
MRYMGAGAAFSVKTKAARRFGVVARIDARRRMARFSEHWRAHGFGVWAVEEAAGDALVGEVGLRRTPDFPGGGPAVEIGWLLARQAWGKGYATEAARAVLSYAFEQAGVDRVVSIARVENVRSERVMTRLGLSRQRTVRWRGQTVVWYATDRSNPSAGSSEHVLASRAG